MPNEYKPTAGALRAATAILEDPDLGEDPMLDTAKIAKIIDSTSALPELLDALKGLMNNPSINLGDSIYDVREREGKGWDGPNVIAWGKAVEAAKAALYKAGVTP